jgi:hypothetical protein
MGKKPWQHGQVITESGGKVSGFIWAHEDRPMTRKYDVQMGHGVQVRNWKRQQVTDAQGAAYRAGAIDEGRDPVVFGQQRCVSDKDYQYQKKTMSIGDFACGGGRSRHQNHRVRAKANEQQHPVEQAPASKHLKGQYTHTHAKIHGHRPTVHSNTGAPLDKKPYRTGRRRKPNGGFYQDSTSGAGSPNSRVGAPQPKVAWQ